MSALTIVLLVALRVAIGWHFFNEGRDHYFDKKWSSQGFLKVAVGPLAEEAKSALPQHHDWDKTLGTPFTEAEFEQANKWYNDPAYRKEQLQTLAAQWAKQPAGKDANNEAAAAPDILTDQHPLYVNPTYGAWAKQVRDDWRATVSEAVGHYGFSAEQRTTAEEQLKKHLTLLQQKLEGDEKDLFEYRAELRRYERMLAVPGSGSIPYEKERITDKKKELAGKPNGWIKDYMSVEEWLRDSLNGIAGVEAASKNPLPEPLPMYKKIDPIVIWLLMIGGGCLILGLFTRLAAFALGTFLLSVVLLQPFWVADAVKTTYFEWVEVIALYMLATTGIGRYAGLDYFLHALFGRKSDKEIVVTEKTTRPVVVKRT